MRNREQIKVPKMSLRTKFVGFAAMNWVMSQECKEVVGTFCEADPDGLSHCWRHERAWDSAQRIIRAQRREAA